MLQSVTELACALAGAVDSTTHQPDAAAVATLLDGLAAALDEGGPAAAEELGELLFDLHASLMAAAALSEATDAGARRLLAAAAQRCSAREVFTLGMAALSQQLRCASWAKACVGAAAAAVCLPASCAPTPPFPLH